MEFINNIPITNKKKWISNIESSLNRGKKPITKKPYYYKIDNNILHEEFVAPHKCYLYDVQHKKNTFTRHALWRKVGNPNDLICIIEGIEICWEDDPFNLGTHLVEY